MIILPRNKIPALKNSNPFFILFKENFTHFKLGTLKQKRAFLKLIKDKANERKIHTLLDSAPALWDSVFSDTGNHGILVFSKLQIKNKFGHDDKGLIPDFMICTKNSDGYQYWIVELKGVSDRIFLSSKNNELFLTTKANKAFFQILEYIDYCSRFQSKFRDEYNLENFCEPKGILVIGNEDELISDKRKMKLKEAWNKLNPNLQIRTFTYLEKNIRKFLK